MPVFHTRTIESILEPVAVQVSKLVILHEEAEDGNAMPDLAMPIQTVKRAVDNLVRVGYDTINSSEDQILKQDMPPALNRVEEASIFLLQASDMLRSDPYSGPARKKLIEGSRGILQGTSSLLLAFDESEVRKIIRVCKNVLEYLAITEVVDTMEDLVTYVKNLSPVLTQMTKEVDSREKELTHQVHRHMLIRSRDQVKTLTPVLISGMKVFITSKQTGQGIVEAQINRDFVVRKVCDEIHEIIRVLQLTTYDEEEWDADDITVMKKAQSAIENKMQAAQNWLADPNALVGSSGEKALRQILEDARRIAERCTNPKDRESILKTVGDLESMVNALSELRQQGKGNSPQAVALAREIQGLLRELQNKTVNGIMNTERSGMRRPAPTVQGKVEQALKWLANPGLDDKGLGEEATRMVVAEGRRLAQTCSGPQRADLLRNCDEVEILTNQLSDLIRKGQGNSPQARAIAQNLSQKLQGLKKKIRDVLIDQVEEDFIDVSTPLKQMSEAAMAPPGSPNRDGNFQDKARNFQAHAAKLADTSHMVATAGGCRNKKTVEAIFNSTKQVSDLTPQVVNAAKIVLMNPNNQATMEHFELLKKQWMDNIERLRGLVDEATDTAAFIKAAEEGILRDTERVEDGIRTNNSPKIVTNASSIARRANRVLQVAQQEAENSEDPSFVERVNKASDGLKSSIAPMVTHAKTMSMNPRDQMAVGSWRKANNALISSVGDVRKAVMVYPNDYDLEQALIPPPIDMSQLHVSAAPRLKSRGNFPDPDFIQFLESFDYDPYPVRKFPEVKRKPATFVSSRPVPDHYADQSQGWMGQEEDPMFQQQRLGPLRNTPPPPVPPPTVPVYPAEFSGYYGAPPRPPPPHDMAPPRPPPPETDDEDEMAFPTPQANQPIMMAAHALHMEAKQWSSKDNEIIAAAKRMALLMAKLSQLVRGEGGSKRDLIATAKAIAQASEEVTRLAKNMAADCTDKRMRTDLLQVCERIPTIGTQLKILSTVKATMLGAQGSDEDQEATEMLVGNAQNLMQSVKETVRAAEAASIKIRVDTGYQMNWVRRRPWYT